ncbi:peptidase inhibitor family I36 protein [Devosia sp. SL43]|uniref:peptidase inhibitor family I36 protein n=1 Tax=Devosia sp. SL43 TaxID=2806348 RepID=UPI001F1F28ED|nr:peptidase inhibitor family I36 protein [Devosia sp. SL43]UJW86809.1 hypothetical protein IM737_06040 [Devosia sp. SL43]
MRRTRPLLALLLTLVTFAASAPAAVAFSENGSHGWSTGELTLLSGPGAAYDFVGNIEADVAIKVLRCQRLWCLVDQGSNRGWTSKDRIAFGRTSTDWPGGINPDYASGGPGTVCLFEGTHYTGASICAGPGRVFQDLALLNLDNRFSSVQVTGNVSAAACRDRFFQSYCERIIESQPVLDEYLHNALSSLRVY